MPAHIYVQLGMWGESAASNEAAWEVSKDTTTRKQQTIDYRDYHALQWLVLTYLQQGRAQKAREALGWFKEGVEKGGHGQLAYLGAALSVLAETGDWAHAGELLAAGMGGSEKGSSPVGAAQAAGGCSHAGGGDLSLYDKRGVAVTRALLAARAGNAKEMTARLSELHDSIKKDTAMSATAKKAWGLPDLTIPAELRRAQGKLQDAIKLLRKATAIIDQLPPPSGPDVDDPHERLGELLLAAKQPKDALAELEIALARHPGRGRLFLYLGRAKEALGDHAGAVASFTRAAEVWKQADSDWPGLDEARAHVALEGR
jgi:tetratricopeptide (TPR) repeat protein